MRRHIVLAGHPAALTMSSMLYINRRRRRVLRAESVALATAMLALAGRPASAVLWDGGGVNSEWIEPANWQFNVLPNSADTATILNDTTTITGVVAPPVFAVELGLGSAPGGLVVTGGVNQGGLNVVAHVAVASAGSLSLGGGGPATSQVIAGSLSTSGTVTVQNRGTVALTGQFTQTAGSVNLSGGTINAASLLSQAGVLRASGDVNANVSIGDGGGAMATLALGPSLDVSGNVKLASDARLAIEFRPALGGGTFDMIDVSGTVTLGGVLDLSVLAGAAPVPGVNYPMLTAGAIKGSFDDIVGTSVGGGSWVPHFDPTFTSINFSETDLPGNMNADETVDQQDVALFAYAIRDPNTYHAQYYILGDVADSYMADMDEDGSNTFADIPLFLDAIEQFGGSSQAALTEIARVLAAVPEPSCGAMVWAALAVVGPRARDVRRSRGRPA
ncbi:MAG: hypothetical protein IT424_06285 [Pirellulales bacterium]|nr:hypothetical protein [Pirellulales bacterium]